MKKLTVYQALIIFAFLYNTANCQLKKESDAAYLATYNVFKFGAIDSKYKAIQNGLTPKSKIPKRVKNSAAVLAKGDFDLITLQEVKHGKAGEAAVQDLVSELLKKHNQKFEWFVSDKIGKGLFDESIAFLYKPDKVTNLQINGIDSDLIDSGLPQNRKFARTMWKIGDFDFTLISCHFSWIEDDPTRRQADYEKLNQILNSPNTFSSDPDVIIMGDFNRYGGDWDDKEYGVLKLDYDAAKWRAPNISIWDAEVKRIKQVETVDITSLGVPDNNPQFLSTTVAKNTRVYDIIFFTSDVNEEFPPSIGNEKYGIDFGIFHFDEKGGFGHVPGAEKLSHAKLKKAYSDHRPLWIRVKTNTGTSDR